MRSPARPDVRLDPLLQSTSPHMKRIRVFGSHLSRGQRRVYGAVAAFYVVAAIGMTWPVYSLFSRARPLVLSMPFSLFYLACFVVASFAILLALYLWETRQPAEENED